MTGIWNKRSLEFQARAATRGNTLSLQLFQNIRQSEGCSFELSIWVLRVSPFFVFPISVSYFSFSVYSSGSCRRAAAFTALPLRQALPALSHQGFASLLCNCGFVDWGLTFPSKGRLLRSGILCRATVYENAMSPTSCYQVTGMAIARDDLDRHAGIQSHSPNPWEGATLDASSDITESEVDSLNHGHFPKSALLQVRSRKPSKVPEIKTIFVIW